ncbi:hypothetical protein EDB89DRAFT_1385192 [Lactarius sanguifluus]|nr:hypothetical protein EDB89DRAFT_1385192 [Lactarius sanguifluus]
MDQARLRASCECRDNPCRASSWPATSRLHHECSFRYHPSYFKPFQNHNDMKASILIDRLQLAYLLLVQCSENSCWFYCSHRSEILRPTVADAPLDARAVSADTACLRRGATRRSARNAHVLHVADAFLDDFLTATVRARLTHLALPHFVGVPPAAAPRLAVLDSTPGLAAALWPSAAQRLRYASPTRCTTAFAPRCYFAHLAER